MLIKLRKDIRPYFDVKIRDNLVCTLLDTNTEFSVYTKDTETLFSKFPNVITTDVVVYTNGLGGNVHKSKMYLIPELFLGNIRYINVPIACVPNDKLSAELVLASNILASSPFTIDYSNRILNITKVRDTVWCNFICEYRANEKENVWVKTHALIQQ